MNPLTDPRWLRFVERRQDSSVFHTVGWLQALNATYNYEPLVYTTSPPEAELTNGIVVCSVRSHFTGSRAVSLPFSDHCQPLVDDELSSNALINYMQLSLDRNHWRYFELRPRSADGFLESSDVHLSCTDHYVQHSIDLRPSLETLFRKFQNGSVQRKIKRAEREHLEYEEGRSERLLCQFYELMILTRRRHGLPPQPLVWFRNIVRFMRDNITIRMALKDGIPAASILTISHNQSVVYKYGCSDSKFQNLGGTALVLWKAIQDAKQAGALEFDLGRSDATNVGLIEFKQHWGGKMSALNYFRYSGRRAAPAVGYRWQQRAVHAVFARMPSSLLTMAGRLLYPHIG
ncbi:MAG: GNAT family N-acetyltransferase [Candidatus Acidiferrales bacterium]